MTFRELVNTYGLTRSEGAVLRYLSDAFKALRSGVPAAARTEEVTDLVEWLGELVRQVDSSLLDEWESLTDPDQPLDAAGRRAGPAAAAHRQRARVHRDGPQRAVPPRAAVGPARAGTTSASWTAAPAGTPTAGARSCGPTSPSTPS